MPLPIVVRGSDGIAPAGVVGRRRGRLARPSGRARAEGALQGVQSIHVGTLQGVFQHPVSALSAAWRRTKPDKEIHVPESVYKVIELVGTSTESWEKAAAAAVRQAAQKLRDLRVAEVSELDMQLKDGEVQSYRAKVKVSFKYEGDA